MQTQKQVNLQKARAYYENKDPNIDTMLGGIPQVHWPDVRNSRSFLKRFWAMAKKEYDKFRGVDEKSEHETLSIQEEQGNASQSIYCLDVGAGIGRITKHVILEEFPDAIVDFLEPNTSFCLEAKRTIPQRNLRFLFNLTGQDFFVKIHPLMEEELDRGIILTSPKGYPYTLKNEDGNSKRGHLVSEMENDVEAILAPIDTNICDKDVRNETIQSKPKIQSVQSEQTLQSTNCKDWKQQDLNVFLLNKPWDLIWVQWVILYFDDDTLLRLFSTFLEMDCKNLVLKCNVTSTNFAYIDDEDGSIIRSENQVRALLTESGWTTILHSVEVIPGFENLYPIHIFGCVPSNLNLLQAE